MQLFNAIRSDVELRNVLACEAHRLVERALDRVQAELVELNNTIGWARFHAGCVATPPVRRTDRSLREVVVAALSKAGT